MDHGAPIESLAFFPSGASTQMPHSPNLLNLHTAPRFHTSISSRRIICCGARRLNFSLITGFAAESLLVTAGGQHVCCWDLLGGRRLLHKLTAHQKTVTSVAVHHIDASLGGGSGGLRLLTASLDGHVKVFNPENFKLTHASKYPAPILSMALSPAATSLAVGMADGTLSVRRRQVKAGGRYDAEATGAQRTRYAPRLTAASFRYFIRGQSAKASAADVVIARRRKVST